MLSQSTPQASKIHQTIDYIDELINRCIEGLNVMNKLSKITIWMLVGMWVSLFLLIVWMGYFLGVKLDVLHGKLN